MCHSDKPCKETPDYKELIGRRQRDFHQGNRQLYYKLRNQSIVSTHDSRRLKSEEAGQLSCENLDQ
jgi:hypothetical protein